MLAEVSATPPPPKPTVERVRVPPPPRPDPDARELADKLLFSRKLHNLEVKIDEDPANDALKRERAELLADAARVPWRRRCRDSECGGGCQVTSHFRGHP